MRSNLQESNGMLQFLISTHFDFLQIQNNTMDEEDNQRRSNNINNRRSSVVSLDRKHRMSPQKSEKSLNRKRNLVQVMSLQGMDEEFADGGLFEQMLMNNQRRSFMRSSNNSQNYQQADDSIQHRNSNTHRRSSNNKIISHDCKCEGSCMDYLCPCYQASNQLCLQGFCCDNCIQMKYRMMTNVIPETRTGCICKNSKCLKSYCKCFQMNKKCDPSICKCQSCENMDIKIKNQINKPKIPQSHSYSYQKEQYQSAFKSTNINKYQYPNVNPKNQLKNQKQPGKNGQQGKNIQQQQQQLSCSCKKSHCLKKYCCCFATGNQCGQFCVCEDCRNRYEQDEDREQQQYQKQRFGRVDSESDDQMKDQNIDKYFYEKSYEEEEMPASMQFQQPDFTRSYQH